MKLQYMIFLSIFIFPSLIWAQSDDSKDDTVQVEEVKEIVEERLEELNSDSSTSLEEPSPVDITATATPEIPVEGGKPEWVEYYQKGEIGQIADGAEFFFGVGSSEKSQTESDSAARLEFARNVETRVESSYQEIASVSEEKEEYNLDITVQVKTDLSLKGVSVSEVWQDSETITYYSLIRISRNEYTRILEQNIREELALQKTRLEQERARVEAEAEQQRLADLEEQNRQEEEARALEEDRRKDELKQQRRNVQRSKYRLFLETTPQAQLIGFRNAQLAPTFQRYGLSMGISPGITPFDAANLLQRISFGYTFFQFLEISGETQFLDNDDSFGWASQEVGAKIRLLNGAGDVIKMSLAAGGKLILFDMENLFSKSEELEQGGTFFCSGIVSFPMALYSHLSFYAGTDRIAAGLITHPLFSIFGDSLGLIGEVNYLIDDRLRKESYDDGWLVQAGLRFKTGKRLSTTLSWIEMEKVSLSLDLFF